MDIKTTKANQIGYRMSIEEEIIKQGGTTDDFKFITKQIITNGLSNNTSPADVAWAILQ